MILSTIQKLSSKHLFERIVLYTLLSVILQKFYAEILLGEAVFYHPQIKQWIFFSLLTIDYLFSVPKLLRVKFQLNAMSLFAFLCIFMILHGTVVGILNQNRPFVIFNDIVPFLMVAFNILRMTSLEENKKEIDLKKLLRSISIVMAMSTFISSTLFFIGITSKATYAFDTIYCSAFFAFLFSGVKIPKFDIFAFIYCAMFAITQTNRTTMLFLLLIAGLLFGKLFFRNYLKGIGALVAILVTLGTIFVSLPEDSGTYQRIMGISKIDLSARTGSVGERQAEWEAVDDKLRTMGPIAELTGLGMGGTYDVTFTHQINKDYGHAHYSWVWFKMRFGQIGYLYLIIFIAMLLYNASQHWQYKKPFNLMVCFLCLFSCLYLVTYVNAIFLLSGLQFISIAAQGKSCEKKEETQTIL